MGKGVGDLYIKVECVGIYVVYNIRDIEDINYLLKTSNWLNVVGDIPSISDGVITVTAIQQTRTVGEFINTSKYTLEFDYLFGTNRSVIKMFHNDDLVISRNCLLEIGGDVPSTSYKSVVVYDEYEINEGSWSNPTIIQTTKFGTSNVWNHIKISRNGQEVKLWVDNTLIVDRVFTTPIPNILWLWKWGSGSANMKNITIS